MPFLFIGGESLTNFALIVLLQCLDGELDFALLVEADAFYLYDIAFFHDVADLLHAAVSEFGDVNEAVDLRHDVDERAEFHDLDDLAFVDFVDFGFRHNRLDPLQRCRDGGA